VLPSDHVIPNEAELARVSQAAADVAKNDYLVTFEVDPTEPHTGYGYIRRSQKIGEIAGAFSVAEFVEKTECSQSCKLYRGRRVLLEQRHVLIQGVHLHERIAPL